MREVKGTLNEGSAGKIEWEKCREYTMREEEGTLHGGRSAANIERGKCRDPLRGYTYSLNISQRP